MSRMLQEVLLEQDPSGWRLLVGCVLLNVTTRTQVDAVRPELFRRWPDEHRMPRARDATLARVLGPLGCNVKRVATLKRMSREFADLVAGTRDGDEGPITAADVAELYGVGDYAADSWAIFVDGRRDVEPQDRVLAAWLAGWHAAREEALRSSFYPGGPRPDTFAEWDRRRASALVPSDRDCRVEVR